MSTQTYKLHTDLFGRLVACIKKSMYGVSNMAFTREMPRELLGARIGDLVFISEKEVTNNALFGPFYIAEAKAPIRYTERKGAWFNIDINKTPAEELAYWATFEHRTWCLLFDKTLSDKISIVWPYNWAKLDVALPSWGLVKDEDAKKLIQFALTNETEARDFLFRHDAL